MRPPGHLSAAIEVLETLDARTRPAGDALKEWGLAHRFAGRLLPAVVCGPQAFKPDICL